jgi:hypothetical protein
MYKVPVTFYAISHNVQFIHILHFFCQTKQIDNLNPGTTVLNNMQNFLSAHSTEYDFELLK